MHRRLFFAVSTLVFLLASLLSVISSDLHDRALPQGIHANVSMMLDFQSSGMDDARALRELTNIGDQRKLGIVKVMPDLDGDAVERQVFVAMDATARGRLPVGTSIRRFGNMPDSTVVPDSRLSSASASGQYYLIRGDQSDVGLHDWLNRNGVTVTWGTDSLRDDIRLLVSQLSFMMSMAAALALIATMVLYWMASKVRSRALRVLAGVSTWRIQKDDMMGVLVPSLCAASCIDITAVTAVGVIKGLVFIPYFFRMLLVLEGVMLSGLFVAMLIVGAVSWPSAVMIMRRASGNIGLRRSALAMKSVVFVAVLAVTAPAMSAMASADSSAREQRVWERLSDQVSIALSYNDDPRLDAKVANVLRAMESEGKGALSYTFTPETTGETGTDPVALVTEDWLDLVRVDPKHMKHAIRVSQDRLSTEAKDVVSQLPGWASDSRHGEDMIRQARYYIIDGDTIPVLQGGSDTMLFPKRLTLIVLDDYSGFSDSGFLVPAATTRNIVMTGLQDVRSRLQRAGLAQRAQVRYVAEEQILQSQFSTYFAWLQAAAFVMLIVSFALTVMVHAMVRAALRARHDYPLMLNGILAGRLAEFTILAESGAALAAGAVITMIALHSTGATAALATGALTILAILVSALSHILSVRRMFKAVNTRTL
ncbi:hypothetical protein CPA40_10715 [Bifidobacterium callitrichos]|uniref:ABC transporter permease n=1 Tax=Bifidobacterium callitrichos TaxID=762209 RepID=A0A2T3G7M8_9BIFI|nr:hypothetical protein [Bifidobacterium callitrichos]PST45510.1 hypothetical protein CPA40_10715 [Bifidobacterium callitrichos]